MRADWRGQRSSLLCDQWDSCFASPEVYYALLNSHRHSHVWVHHHFLPSILLRRTLKLFLTCFIILNNDILLLILESKCVCSCVNSPVKYVPSDGIARQRGTYF